MKDFQNMQILVIDDDSSNIRLIEQILKKNGYVNIGSCTSAKEGLEAAGREPPDLIILDLMMPDMNGFEFCRKVQASENLCRIPVIVMTGSVEDIDEAVGRVFDLGAVDFILKPVSKNELLVRVQSAFRLKQAGDMIQKELEKSRALAETLQKSNAFADAIIDTSPCAIVITDPTGIISRVNNAYLKMLGYASAGELIGRAMVDLAPWEKGQYETTTGTQIEIKEVFFESTRRMVEELFEHGYVYSYQGCMKRKDDKIVITEENNFLIYNEQKEIEASVSIILDISERRQAEKQQALLMRAVEQAEEIIFICDSPGHIMYVNPTFCNLTGYTKEEIIGAHVSILESSRHDKQFYAKMMEAILKGDVWKSELFVSKKNGGTLEVKETISPIKDSRGEIINFVTVQRDITQESLVEQQLRQAQKMEAIGTLAGGIAHDFNNILAAIMGYTEMSLDETFDGSSLHDNLKYILKSSMRAKELVQQILAFSRAGRNERRPVRLEDLVRESTGMLRASIPATIEIKSRFKTEAGILADPTQIAQVILNLSTNAADAMMDRGGVLEIAVDEATIAEKIYLHDHALVPGKYVRLLVKDSGCGIEPEFMERIFEPFFTTKAVGKGTGMGLAVIHGIVHGHGGAISVESRRGAGTCFAVYFPMLEGEQSEERQSGGALHVGNEHILLVDDEEMLLNVSKKILESMGYKVTAYDRSSAALDAFRARPEEFDLLITDQTMPGMTGYELATRLLEIKPQIPIILCTGYSETVSLEKAQSAGIKELVMKPIDRKAISRIIRNVLDSEKAGPDNGPAFYR